jgi:hypothetical protein
MLLDLILHKDAYLGADPVLLVFVTAIFGRARVGQPDREQDLIRVSEELQPFGHRRASLRLAGFFRDFKWINDAVEKLDLNLSESRRYQVHLA